MSLTIKRSIKLQMSHCCGKIGIFCSFILESRSENKSLPFGMFYEKMAENILQQRLLFKDNMTSHDGFARQPHAATIPATSRHRHCGQSSANTRVVFSFSPQSPDDASKLLIPIYQLYVYLNFKKGFNSSAFPYRWIVQCSRHETESHPKCTDTRANKFTFSAALVV